VILTRSYLHQLRDEQPTGYREH